MEHVFAKTARYYDKLYAQKDYAGEVRRLIALMDVRPTGDQVTLLDVACGTGLHLEQLAKHFIVEGLDICPELLDIARGRLPEVPFHLGDMLDFDLGRQFHVVTCLFSSIGYAKTLEELRAAVGRLAAHVRPGGILAIEPWFTPLDWHPHTVHGMYIDEPGLKIARVSTSMVRDRVSIFDLHHLIGRPEGTEHVVEHHEMGLFEVEEMTAVIEEAGLAVSYDAEGLTGRGIYIGKKIGS
jgi:SAM-dependent methyltransferase